LHLNPLANKSYEQIKGMMGTILGEDAGMDFAAGVELDAVPATFDSRDYFSGCIHEIRDQ